MSFIILFTGYTAVGKSTLSKYLSETLNIQTLHSAKIRKELNLTPSKKQSDSIFDFTSNKRGLMDDLVYSKILTKSEEYIKDNQSIIIDAGNFFFSRRQKYYELGDKYLADIFVIKVVCSDESQIKLRLQKREKNYNNSNFNEAASINIYNSTKLIMEDPTNDFDSKENLPNIIEYDTASKKVEIINKKSKNIKLIIHALENFSFPI